MVTRSAAEAARDKIASTLRDLPGVTGVGVVRTKDGFGVRVNVQSNRTVLPPDIDGVPVSTRVSGRVVAHSLV